MKKRGKSILIIGLFSILLALVITPFILSSSAEFSTVCYNEKHSIIDHEIICEIQNNLQSSLNHEVVINLNLLNGKLVRNVEIYEFIEKTKEVPIYETICNPYDKETINGTTHYNNCTQIQLGTKTVFYEDLEKLNINSDLNKIKWSAEQLQFKSQEKRKFLIKWKTNLDRAGSGWGSSGNWKINPENWWNASWSYKKVITIFNQTGESLQNYTQHININLTTEIKAGKINSSCEDIRFLNSSETGELSYKILGCNNETNSSFDVRLEDASTGNYILYMYYGDPTAATTQNENQTYLFYDGATQDRSSEYTKSNVGGTCTQTYDSLNKKYNITSSGGAGNCAVYVTGLNISNATVTANIKDIGYAYVAGIIIRVIDGDNHYKAQKVNLDQRLRIRKSGIDYDFQILPSGLSFGTYYHWTLFMQGTTLNNTVNGYSTQATDANFTWGGAGIFNYYEGTTSFYNLIIRKRVEIEPIYSVGEEESYDTIAPETTTPTIIPAQPKTTDNLQCNATLTDNLQINLTAYWKWYKNDIFNFSGTKTNIVNGTPTIITTLDATNTKKGEQWICEVLPFDDYNYGDAKNSSSVIILNTVPTHTNPSLKTLSGKNFSYENLTCYNQSTYDVDNDNVTNIYNWYKNSQSLAVLNLPLESSVKDYSTNNNNGILEPNVTDGPQFISGKVGNALSFDGVDDYIFIADSNNLDFTNKKSWEIWFKRASFNTLQMLFDKTNGGTNYRLSIRADNKLEFSFLILPVPTSLVWITDTAAEFNLGAYNQTKWNGTAVTLNSTLAEQQIFFDGFESGSFSTYGWVVSGPGNPWIVSNETPFEGVYHARAKQTGAGTETILETSVSTAGFYNINFSFYVKRVGLDPADDFSVYYYNGTNWNLLESSAGSPADDLTYILRSHILPDDGNNNSNLKIRFRCTAGAVSEWCDLDNVKLKGNGTAFYNNGNYTSEIFDAGDMSEWKNFSWAETLPTNTDLTFQIRSCNDFVCAGESFVGPDNTANTYFTNSEFNDISFIADNKYFQYKAYFSTTDIKKSAGLYSVSVNYIKNITNGLINLTSSSAITDTNWHYAAVTFDDAILTDNLNLYLDGILEKSKTEHGTLAALNNDLYIGKRYPENDSFFNGSIDEFRIYNKALSQSQVTNNHLLKYNTIVSEETSGGDNWMCQVTPNDGEDSGETLNSSTAEIKWAITFDVRDSYSNVSLDYVTISCNYTGFNQAGDTTNPYGPYGFPSGSWGCGFAKDGYFNKTKIFVADNDKTVNVVMSESAYLTPEEHTWLKWLYNCWHNGDCWDLLSRINQTTTQIWQRLTGTDASVITQEDVLSYTLSDSSNISINYTIEVPYKEGVAVNELLPIRLYFWFTDTERTQCYSQDKGTDTNRAEQPYCLPLVAEILGPNDGTVSFQVDLRPALPAGIYNFTRSIEIDPLGIWTQYGREDIGQIEITEDMNEPEIDFSDEKRINKPISLTPPSGSEGGGTTIIKEKEIIKIVPQGETRDKEREEKIKSGEAETEISGGGITGGVIGARLLSGEQIVAIIAILCGLFVVTIICKTIIRIKKK